MLDGELVRARETSSRALMLVLHGLGDSLEGYRWLPEMLRLPWLNYLLVNAPDDYYGGFSWYDFDGDAGVGIERSRRLLVELLADQVRRGFPAESTFLFGFSQGCLMTLEVGLRYPEVLAGLIGISGHVHEPERLLQQLPAAARHQRVLVTHGTFDPLIPFRLARDQIRLLQESGLPIQWHEFPKDHTIAGEEELGLIRRFLESNRPPPAAP